MKFKQFLNFSEIIVESQKNGNMDLKGQLLNALQSELNKESALVFELNIEKRKKSADVATSTTSRIRLHSPKGITSRIEIPATWSDNSYDDCGGGGRSGCGLGGILLTLIIISAIVLLVFLGGKFVYNIFDLNLFISILIVFAILVITSFALYFIIKLIRYVSSIFDNKLNFINIQSIEVKNEFDDDVYYVISSTYETLCNLKRERERQAKNSFNVALSLIVVGVLVVFGGVFLLFRKNILEGVLSSVVGSISSIIGGTIIKLYKDTNDRMDKLNADLFTLNSVKVQYAMILKINNEKKRDVELSRLIQSIGKITK